MAVLPRSYLSTFSGIGALDLAIGRVFPDARCLLYVERETPAVATLAARMESGDLDAAPVWSDIRTVPGGHLRGRTDLVVGGFPCQDISSAGKRTGILGSRSGLFFDLIRLVRDVGAEYIFLENVAALTVRGLDTVLGTLAEVGFDAEWGCLKASDAGAPHDRDRWWCLAWDARQLAHPERPEWRPDLHRGRDERDGRDTERHEAFSTSLGAGRDVADALRLQRSGRGSEVRDGRGVREVRQAVGDSRCVLRIPGHGQGRPASPEASRDAPHSRDSYAGDQLGHPECQRGSLPTSGRLSAEQGPHSAGIALADAPDSRWRARVGQTYARQSDTRWRIPYPPGPGDRSGWSAYLDAYPNLAPAIESAVRRGADGPATRVDRLRGLGNAVVPDQAEWALRLLWFRAFGEWPS